MAGVGAGVGVGVGVARRFVGSPPQTTTFISLATNPSPPTLQADPGSPFLMNEGETVGFRL